jgi:aminocarboxymuconate-semialdehyde decarboxylase
MTSAYWDLDEKLAFMEEAGIGQSVISLGNPWFDPVSTRAGLAAARKLNDEFAGLSAATGARLVGMGVLPPGPIQSIAAVIRDIADTPGLCGVISGCRIARTELDDPTLEPVWDALDETSVPILFHPHAGISPSLTKGFGRSLNVGLGFPIETTVSACRLLLGGVLDNHPGLRIGFTHGGGALPYLVGRLDAVWRKARDGDRRSSKPPSAWLSSLFFDGMVFSSDALRLLVAVAGAPHVGFGTDHPFAIADPAGQLRTIETLDLADQDALRYSSASAFLGLPQVVDIPDS